MRSGIRDWQQSTINNQPSTNLFLDIRTSQGYDKTIEFIISTPMLRVLNLQMNTKEIK